MIDTFVVDLDGTLLQKDGTLSSEVCDYMIELQKRGFTLVIATGRKHSEAMHIINQLKLEEYKNAIILSDGQYLIDYSDKTELSEPFLEFPEDFNKIICSFGSEVQVSWLMTPNRDYVVYPSIFCCSFLKHFIWNLVNFNNPFKVMFSGSKVKVGNIEKIAIVLKNPSAKPGGSIKSSYQLSFINDKKRFEFKSKSVNKCEALKKYLKKKEIVPERVAVFGNDENDMCLFEFFQNSYVIDLAQQNVKDFARNMIPYEEGGGVVKAINMIIERGVEQ